MKTLNLATVATLAALPAAAHTDSAMHVHEVQTGAMALAAIMITVAVACALKR